MDRAHIAAMMPRLRSHTIPFPELSYANDSQPRLKRWVIRSIEGMAGRDRYAALYGIWRDEIVPSGDRIFGSMLDLIDVRVSHDRAWPPQPAPDAPLVIIANHPFGIGDGIAVLSLAEQIGRPFKGKPSPRAAFLQAFFSFAMMTSMTSGSHCSSMRN